MQLQEAREQLQKLQSQMAAYRHAQGLLSFDGSTTAPKNTTANRAKTLSVLGEVSYKLSTGKDTVDLLEYLDARKESLSEKEQRQVFLMLKSIRFMQKIPMDEFLAYRRLLVESGDVWRRSKEQNDFPAFEPYLEQIIETKKRHAAYEDPAMDPYDYWLNEYETGLNQKTCDTFFAAVR